MRGPRRPAPPRYGVDHPPPPGRATRGELWGLAVVIVVIIVTAGVIFQLGPVVGVGTGLVLTVAAIVVVTVLDR